MLLWADGFDHYGTMDVMLNQGGYRKRVDTFGDVSLQGNARTGNYAVQIDGNPYNLWCVIERYLPGARTTAGMGMAMYLGQSDSYGFGFSQGEGDYQVCAIIKGDGSIAVTLGQGGQEIGRTAAGVFAFGSYSYVELFLFCDNVQGQVILRVNNVVVLTIANQNTQAQGSPNIGGMGFGRLVEIGARADNRFDDLYVWDRSGDAQNDFAGDVRCYTLFPNANGANQNWLPHGNPDAFNDLNGVPPNPGRNYISAANVGDLSTFSLEQLPPNAGTTFGVMTFAQLSKADAGDCQIEYGIASSGDTDLSPPVPPGTAPVIYSRALQHDPHTGQQWTPAGVNAMQAIFERVV